MKKKIKQKIIITCNWACTRKAPNFLAEGSLGKLSLASAKDLIMGKKMPPALAVVLGIAGEIAASLNTKP